MPRWWIAGSLAWALAAAMPSAPAWSQSAEDSTDYAPPDLPSYDQPPAPGDGYVWTPGYWAWSDDDQDFYWVPGTWALAPQPEFLWTPGYWVITDVVFVWHPGYWSRHVGFYGGINYGYGFPGDGSGGRFSYNGGSGIQARPTSAQLAGSAERRIEATPAQRQQAQSARQQPTLYYQRNQGQPPIAATPRPGVLSGPGVVGAKPGGPAGVMRQSGTTQPAIQNAGQPRPSDAGQPRPSGTEQAGPSSAPRPGTNRPVNPAAGGSMHPGAPSPGAPQPETPPDGRRPPDKLPPRTSPPAPEHPPDH